MFKKQKTLTLLMVFIFLFFAPFLSRAKAGKIIYLKVIRLHFTTGVTGLSLLKKTIKTEYVRNPEEGRLLVVDLECGLDKETTFFCSDFSLKYYRNEELMKNQSMGMSVISKKEIAFAKSGIFLLKGPGTYLKFKAKHEKIKFAVLFYVENDIKTAILEALGKKIRLQLGSERPYSVTLIRDKHVPLSIAQKIKKSVEKANCRVSLRVDDLSVLKGVAIVHQVKTRNLALEISQRVMILFPCSPLIIETRKAYMTTNSDIVILLKNNYKNIRL